MAPTHKSASKPSSRKAYVACDLLSWRPHPLPKGTEVSEILPEDVLEDLIERGDVTHEAPADE